MSRTTLNDLLRALPGVDELLADPVAGGAADRHGHALVVDRLRRALDALRARVRAGDAAAPEDVAQAAAALPGRVAEELDRRADGRLRSVINATGVLVHTNLGRAPLGATALQRLAERGGGALDLEMDLETGRRGRRGRGCEDLLCELTGAEAALVVNNCAAAVVLALAAHAAGRHVVVSRGELVEIGGSFRLPEIFEAAGVRLAEVGTTNRTRVEDYERTLGDERLDPALLLKVHPSNFRVVGFTEEASPEELVELGRRTGVPVVVDQGSGALEDLAPWGVEGEPPIPGVVAAGADLVLFSGDKLLGGPQSGCVVGRREAVERCRRHPLNRVLRPGRLTLLALEATLWAHATGRHDELPVMAMLRMPATEVERRALALAARLAEAQVPAEASVVASTSQAGGGSSPQSTIPTHLVRLGGPSAERLARELRLGRPALVGRIEAGAFIVDLRSVPPELDELVARRLAEAIRAVAAD